MPGEHGGGGLSFLPSARAEELYGGEKEWAGIILIIAFPAGIL
jgi:hypothetical protein